VGRVSPGLEVLGFEAATDGDEVFRVLVLARVIESTSKLDSLRVLDEAGIGPPSYPTVKRRLPVFATEAWRQALAAACAAHAGLGPASLVLYDVSTLVYGQGREQEALGQMTTTRDLDGKPSKCDRHRGAGDH
jgi:hypothetical protein